MKTHVKKLTLLLAAIIAASFTFQAFADGNPKRGRVYYKMVCTVCHLANAGKVISPSAFTMEEWETYIDEDTHDKTGETNDSVKYYVSKEYRGSIADRNKAAKKFRKMPNDKLLEDIRAFTVGGAKDSDTPASCE